MAFVLALAQAGVGAPLHAENAALAQIEALFAAGDFDGTARRVNEILIRDFDLPAEQRAAIYVMKARLELAFDRPSELKLWLAKAYQADPALALDPVKDPPQLLAVFDEVRGIAPKQAGGKQTVDLKEGTGVWKSLTPFGVGHFVADAPKDGALFLSAELLAVLATVTLPEPEQGPRRPQRVVFGMTSLIGLYGYELLDMTSLLANRDPPTAATVRSALSYFPLGVAQAKNREPVKAWTVATTHAALLAAATLAPQVQQRHGLAALLAIAWGVSIWDGLTHHSDALAGGTRVDRSVAIGFVPTLARDGESLGLAARMTLSL